MHNLALALKKGGHDVSGSDDEIYDPARTRLEKQNLLPPEGWNPDRITPDIDLVILGMHAKADNPELLKAQELGLKIQSFPEFIRSYAADKTRVVIAGSHGKTTTTSMLMHGLKKAGVDYDYLVGAQLDGFDLMVKLSDAPLMIIEGDEYLSSSIDRVPKIFHYDPHLTVVTGIAWDHINVFPTEEEYVKQFSIYLHGLDSDATAYWFGGDPYLPEIVESISAQNAPYFEFDSYRDESEYGVLHEEKKYPLQIFGRHNLQNLKAASLLAQKLGINVGSFLNFMKDFTGAAKRSELIGVYKNGLAYKDFAHAPSKVAATSQAMKDKYPDHDLVGILELHTYSSLNKEFIPHYNGTLDSCDKGFVVYSPKTLEIKKLDPIDPDYLQAQFNHTDLSVYTDPKSLEEKILSLEIQRPTVLLWMSSGHFGSTDIVAVSTKVLD